MDPKLVTKQLQHELDTEGWGVVSFDRNEALQEDLLKELSLWRIGEKTFGKHVEVLPSALLRKQMWVERNNKWFKEGRGAAWAHKDPESGTVICGICVLVSFDKGVRLDKMTDADVFYDQEDES